MAKKTEKKVFDKEALFENYFQTCDQVFEQFDQVFGVDGIRARILGIDESEAHGFSSPAVEQAAKAHLRASMSWWHLSNLYDYAVDGIDAGEGPESIVIDGGEVISFITTNEYYPSIEWERLVRMGDGRVALDTYSSIEMDKLALLANVDIRTVRNAISAGELVADKIDGYIFITNDSARNWLTARRGFKPSKNITQNFGILKEITSPAEFGAFLLAQRDKIGMGGDDKKLVVFHPSVDYKAILEIERGAFKLPIDTAFPIADFYQLDRKEFLACVMRVFFNEQLLALSDSLKTDLGDSHGQN